MHKKIFLLFAGAFILLTKGNCQTKAFNQGWNFIGLEFTNKTKIDSLRKLGKNWQDQFLTEEVNTDKELDAPPAYKDVLHVLENKKWEKVSLPHIAFPEPLVIVKAREGMAYYKKDFIVSNTDKGKIISIEFEGVTQVGNVWVNGQYMGRFTGGYIPFEIDITGVVKYGAKNTILLEANNKANPLVPPGKPVEKLDFIYYSGIYRDVWLHIKNPLHITHPVSANKVAGGGIFVSYPKVSSEQAIIDVQTHVQNSENLPETFVIVQQLKDNKQRVIAESKSTVHTLSAGHNEHYTQQMTVLQPLLWHPDHPHLYTLHTSLLKENNIIDNQVTRIGIRSFEISRSKGLLINGEPYRVRGTNRHQNYPYIGNALSNNAQYRDAWLIKNAGINGVRAAHYPMDPSFMDAADELGILIIDAIPGWQYFNRNPVFAENVIKDIRSTIRRDRNHPSVFLWEVSLNETYPPADFRCRQAETAKEEWQGRKNFYTSGDSYYTKACWDVPYDDWNGDPGARNNTTYPHNAFLIREYGDYEFGGGSSTTRKLRGDGQEALLQQAWNLQWEHNKNLKAPYCIGDFNWAFYDGLAGVVVGIEGWGVADIFRIPKYAYYFFKSQQSPIKNPNLSFASAPMLYIANDWANPTPSKKVVVYSNCNEVELYVNDKLLCRQKPDNGVETGYGTELDKGGQPFDGGNANHLKHPPFTFHNIMFKPGTIKAIGYINGKAVATQSVATPAKAATIQLQIAENGKPLQPRTEDIVFVYAKITDPLGNLVVTANNTITLKVEGNAVVASPATVNAEAGIATFLLKINEKTNKLKLVAECAGLQLGKKDIF